MTTPNPSKKECCRECEASEPGHCTWNNCPCHAVSRDKEQPSPTKTWHERSKRTVANHYDAPSPTDWEGRFDAIFQLDDFGKSTAVQDKVKSFIREIESAAREEGRKEAIEELFEIETEKWKDAEHCTCLGYALVALSGGEDTPGGEAMEKRLKDSTGEPFDKK